MDNPQTKERSYRIVHAMRLKNRRENRLLHEKLYSKQGLHTTFVNELNAVSKEQQRIRRELSLIRKTIATTWGMLPARGRSPSAGEASRPVRHDPSYIVSGLGSKEGRSRRRMAKTVHSRSSETASHKDASSDGEGRRRVGGSTEQDATASDVRRAREQPTLPSIGDQKNEVKAGRETGGRAGKDAVGVQAAREKRTTTRENSEDAERSKDKAKKRPGAKEDRRRPEAPRDKPPEGGTVGKDALSSGDIGEVKGKIMKRLGATEEKGQPPGSETPARPAAARTKAAHRLPVLAPIEEQEQEETEEENEEVAISAADAAVPSAKGTRHAVSEGDSSTSKSTSKSSRAKRRNSEPNRLDAYKYNPDGSIRTVHTMPDMESRLREAKKARYIRHKALREIERELTISEILGKSKEETQQVVHEVIENIVQ